VFKLIAVAYDYRTSSGLRQVLCEVAPGDDILALFYYSELEDEKFDFEVYIRINEVEERLGFKKSIDEYLGKQLPYIYSYLGFQSVRPSPEQREQLLSYRGKAREIMNQYTKYKPQP